MTEQALFDQVSAASILAERVVLTAEKAGLLPSNVSVEAGHAAQALHAALTGTQVTKVPVKDKSGTSKTVTAIERESLIQDVSIEMLANDFLQINDASLETRAYLAEKVLPTLVLSLKNLLAEVRRKELLQSAPFDANNVDMVAVITSDEGPYAPQVKPFDPINWLAQYLFRNNPKYTKKSESLSIALPTAASQTNKESDGPMSNTAEISSYLDHMSTVSASLKKRMTDMEGDRRNRIQADRLARQREKERKRQLQDILEKEKIKVFTELGASIFKTWTQGVWRFDQPYLLGHEILSFVKMLQTDAVPITEANKESNEAVAQNGLQRYSEKLQALISNKLSRWLGNKEDEQAQRIDEAEFTATVLESVNHLNGEQFDILLEKIKLHLKRHLSLLDKSFNDAFFVPVFRSSESAAGARPFESIQELKSLLLKSMSDSDFQKSLQLGNVSVDALIWKILTEFCSQSDSLFYARKQRLLERAKENQITVYEFENFKYELQGFCSYLAGQTSLKAASQFLNMIETAYGISRETAQSLYSSYEQRKKVEAEQAVAAAAAAQQRELGGDADDGIDPFLAVKEQRQEMLVAPLDRVSELINMNAIKANFNATIRMIFRNPVALSSKIDAATKEWMLSLQFTSQFPSDVPSTARFVADESRPLEDESFKLLVDCLHLYCETTFNSYQAIQERIRNRRELEAKAMADALAQVRRIDLSSVKLAESIVSIVDRFFRNYYSAISVYVSILEPQPSDGRSKLSPKKQRLKYVAASAKDRNLLLNQTLSPEDGISFSVLNDKKPKYVPNVREAGAGVKLFGLTAEDRAMINADFQKRGSLFMTPMYTADGNSMGLFSVDNIDLCTESGVETFKEDDFKFLTVMAQLCSEGLETLDRRQKLIVLGQNSLRWASNMIEIDLDFYVVEHEKEPVDESNNSSNSGADVPKLVPKLWLVVNNKEERDPVTGLPRFEPINPDSFEKQYLWHAIKTKEMVTDTFSFNSGSIAIPILDGDTVVALVGIKQKPMQFGRDDKQPVEEQKPVISTEQLKELEKSMAIFTQAVAIIRHEPFGTIGETALVGESIDEESRVSMLFQRLVLRSIQDTLIKLDNTAIAEIKSYRKPPVVIHTIIKCVLFVFGRTREQVDKWALTIKYLNTDLLKAMTEYDPTTIQRKRRFVRIEKEMKNIPHGDVRHLGSKPTKDMYNWLIISMELRHEAVAARKRNKAMFEKFIRELNTKEVEADEEKTENVEFEDERDNSFE